MHTVSKICKIPEKSIIGNGFGKIDYFDTFKIQISTNNQPVDIITSEIFESPKWVDALMKIRDSIVGVFGLKTTESYSDKSKTTYSIGDRIAYFKILNRNSNEIVMAENDKHLNFRTSVMVDGDSIYLSTIVQFNNIFGRLYFFPVKPFHQLIIKTSLKGYSKSRIN